MKTKTPYPITLSVELRSGQSVARTVTVYPRTRGMILSDADHGEVSGHTQKVAIEKLRALAGWAEAYVLRTTNRKPFNDREGYKASLRSAAGKGWVVIYDADAAGIDVGGDRYAVSCEAHGTIVGDTSMPRARLSMKMPEQFCDGCRDAKDGV